MTRTELTHLFDTHHDLGHRYEAMSEAGQLRLIMLLADVLEIRNDDAWRRLRDILHYLAGEVPYDCVFARSLVERMLGMLATRRLIGQDRALAALILVCLPVGNAAEGRPSTYWYGEGLSITHPTVLAAAGVTD